MLEDRRAIHVVLYRLNGLPGRHDSEKWGSVCVCDLPVFRLWGSLIFPRPTFVVVLHFGTHSHLIQKITVLNIHKIFNWKHSDRLCYECGPQLHLIGATVCLKLFS